MTKKTDDHDSSDSVRLSAIARLRSLSCHATTLADSLDGDGPYLDLVTARCLLEADKMVERLGKLQDKMPKE